MTDAEFTRFALDLLSKIYHFASFLVVLVVCIFVTD